MSSLVIPPVIRWTLGALGAVIVVRWAVREVRRVNAELDQVRASGLADQASRAGAPTLRRDPSTGEYRL
jgi:hypothetical protein